MQIEIHSHESNVPPTLREYAEGRLRFALGRFEDSLSRIALFVYDAAGPRAGIDKECRIEIRMPPTEILIKETGADAQAMIDRAADRASRGVSRELDRRRIASG